MVRLALVATAVLLAGCSFNVSQRSLEGSEWALTGWSVPTTDPVQYRINADFDDGKVSGKAAVNRYTATYKQGPGTAFTVSQPVSTMMGGSPEAMQGEQSYFGLLARVRSYRRESGVLTLSDETGLPLLVFSPRRK